MTVDWSIRGPSIATCNCAWGCPCQFNALPTYGDCRAAVAMRIDQGHFADTDLSGLCFAGLFAWPGPIHEGLGEALPVVEERANDRQREAILTIMSGQESEPGATIFNVFASTFEKVHDPQFKTIAFELDIDRRNGRFSIPDLVEVTAEPIRNPVTGQEHRARVALPGGFEYAEAEFASGSARARGTIPLDWVGRHSHLSTLHLTPSGPVH